MKIRAHWERCPVPPRKKKPPTLTGVTREVFQNHRDTLAWTWRNYVIVRCTKNDQSTGRYLRTFQYYIIFPDGKPHPVTEQLIGMCRPNRKKEKRHASRFTLPILQNWVLKKVQEQTPVDIEDITEIYNYDE